MICGIALSRIYNGRNCIWPLHLPQAVDLQRAMKADVSGPMREALTGLVVVYCFLVASAWKLVAYLLLSNKWA